MRILVVGPLNEGQTTRMRMDALGLLGHEVRGVNEQEIWKQASWLSSRFQHRFGIGPIVSGLNNQVVAIAREWKPQLLFAEKQEQLRPGTLQELRRLGVRLLHYTPDPYFSLSWKQTRHMNAAMPLYDYLVTSKQYELEEYRKIGPQVVYVPFGFAEWVHRPVSPRDARVARDFTSDVCFVGGWEPRRQMMLEGVASTGCELKVWGNAWDHLVDGRWTIRRAYRTRINSGGLKYTIARSETLAPALRGGEILGDKYAWALSLARICVGFLSGLCPDRHTTRTFEIPACGTMMLADRSEEHRTFFEEGKEAEFFSSADELRDKVSYFLRNDGARERIAAAGYARCFTARYSYIDRMSDVMSAIG